MDLSHQRVEQSQVTPLHHVVIINGGDENELTESRNEAFLGVIDGNCGVVRELGMESGNGFAYSDDVVVNNVYGFDDPEDDDFGVEFREGSEIRVVTVESGSDDEVEDDDRESEREIWGIDLNGEDVYENYDDEDDVSVTIPFVWDSVPMEDRGVIADEYDWEEVDGSVAEERETLSVFAEADVSSDNSVSFSVSPMVSLEGLATGERVEGSGNLGWEVLLNAHTLEINFDASRELYIVGDHDDVLQSAEYETLFDQFAEAGITNLRLPPTSQYFIKNLPMVRVEVEDDEGMICAVCKDDMNIGSKAVQLPCNHVYHGECILPWLGMRNTCPVCRYELPTDDVEYEQRKLYRTTSHDLVL